MLCVHARVLLSTACVGKRSSLLLSHGAQIRTGAPRTCSCSRISPLSLVVPFCLFSLSVICGRLDACALNTPAWRQRVGRWNACSAQAVRTLDKESFRARGAGLVLWPLPRVCCGVVCVSFLFPLTFRVRVPVPARLVFCLSTRWVRWQEWTAHVEADAGPPAGLACARSLEAVCYVRAVCQRVSSSPPAAGMSETNVSKVTRSHNCRNARKRSSTTHPYTHSHPHNRIGKAVNSRGPRSR